MYKYLLWLSADRNLLDKFNKKRVLDCFYNLKYLQRNLYLLYVNSHLDFNLLKIMHRSMSYQVDHFSTKHPNYEIYLRYFLNLWNKVLK
jgi:hypothetical protein